MDNTLNKSSLRTAYGKTLAKLGEENKNIVVLDADLSVSTKTCLFRDRFPDRFFDMGISEADMMGTAAGLASCGKTVFVSTFALFASGRAWEQVRSAICYPGLNVKIVATHGGLSVGEDGNSHQALEDIALMRVIPKIRVIVPCDAKETEEVIYKIAKENGPFYVRLTRPELPIIYKNSCPFNLGKAIQLKEGNDITIMATGIMVKPALEAANILERRGIEARVLDMACIKPIDDSAINLAAKETRGIVTCEDHSIIGGLGDAVGSVIVKKSSVPLRKVGIEDRFGESGTSDELLKKYGLTKERIVEKAMEIMKMKKSNA